MSMMGVKRDTKAFSNPANDRVSKSETAKNLAPQDLQKIGGEDVGAVLNQAADPNWIDPAKKLRGVGSDKMDKDAFMKLMLAQMKNQDPTNPLKSHEMAAQLAQFSQLEQLQNVNQTLDQMKLAQKPTETYQSLNFIGKGVAGDSARVHRAKGDKDHDFTFTLPDDAKEVVIKVRNEQGDIVRQVKLANMKKGENLWSWNGKSEKDMVSPTGDYQFLIEAKGSNDKKLAVKTDFDGTITGVNYTPEGPVLMVGNQSIKLKDVKRIIDPRLNQKGQNVPNVAVPDLKKSLGAADTESKGAAEAPVGEEVSVKDQVGLSRPMMNLLDKETKTIPPSKPQQAKI